MQRIGDTKAAKKLVKALTLKPSDLELLDTAADIAEHPDAVEKAFMARELVQCTLPHSDPGDVPIWTRRNGDLTLAIQPGVKLDGKSYGYPFGTVPRLLLYWIVTEANRTKSRRLYPGSSEDGSNTLSNFMRDLGMNPGNGTGKRSDRRRLENAADRLFASHISFHRSTVTDAFTREQRVSMEVASASDFWWSNGSPEQSLLWQSWIELGEKFFQAITASVVPIDFRVIRGVKRSALALDLYGWACHRAYSINKSGKSQRISWASLHQQFGSEYASVDEFARKARAALLKVKTLWRKFDNNRPGLLLEFEKGGLRLRPGSLLSVLPELPGASLQLDIEDAIATAPARRRLGKT